MSDRIHCPYCLDTGIVCENHPRKPWTPEMPDTPFGRHLAWLFACECGAGMPCACCAPETVPQNGTHSILECFTPAKFRETVQ